MGGARREGRSLEWSVNFGQSAKEERRDARFFLKKSYSFVKFNNNNNNVDDNNNFE